MIPFEISRIFKYIVIESGLGEGRRESLLMSIEFQFCRIKKFWSLVAQKCEYN